MRNLSDARCTGNRNTFCGQYLFPENRAVYDIMWKIMVERGRLYMAIWRMCIACWITKAAHTHSQYMILIAFKLPQCLQESASMLRSTYTACLLVGAEEAKSKGPFAMV
jgi:hypothetical protein